MSFILIALSIIIAGGLLALILCRNSRLSTLLGASATVVGCLIAIVPILKSLFLGNVETIHLVWDMPYASFFLKLDPLSAFFLLPIFVLAIMAAIYGKEYLMAYRDEKWLGIFWFFFNLLVVSMAMVCLAIIIQSYFSLHGKSWRFLLFSWLLLNTKRMMYARRHGFI